MSTPTGHPGPRPADEREPAALLPDDAPPAPRRPGTRRTALVMVPLLAALVAAGVVGGRMMWEGTGGHGAGDTEFFCWDGQRVPSLSQCSEPRGTDGLAWVLPSFRPDRLDCVDELEQNPDHNRPVMWTCEHAVAGRTAAVTYSQVTGQRAALRYFDKLHGDSRVTTRSPDGRSELFVWQPSRTGDGRWRVSLLLRDAPYAVTAVASSRRDVERVLERRVRIRPPDARRGVELS